MIYEITKKTVPTMKRLGEVTKCIKILLSKAPKVVFEPLIMMFFLIFGAQMSYTKFQKPGLKWKDCAAKWSNQTLICIHSDYNSPLIGVSLGGI